MPREQTIRSSGINGWGAGREMLERIPDERRREQLAELLARVGVQGGPALTYAARRLRWHTEHRAAGAEQLSVPLPSGRVKPAVAELIDRRVIQLLDEAGLPVEHRPQRSAA